MFKPSSFGASKSWILLGKYVILVKENISRLVRIFPSDNPAGRRDPPLTRSHAANVKEYVRKHCKVHEKTLREIAPGGVFTGLNHVRYMSLHHRGGGVLMFPWIIQLKHCEIRITGDTFHRPPIVLQSAHTLVRSIT